MFQGHHINHQHVHHILQTQVYNVTGIKCYLYGNIYSYEGDRQQQAYLRIYEVYAYRASLSEILRIKNTSATISIGGVAATSAHKLRIYKGSTVYGIPLVATTHAEASALRIYDGSSVKALQKAD